MPNQPPEWVEMLLWCVAGLSIAWVCLPMLLAMLGQTRCAILLAGGPETLQPTDADPDYADLFDWLHELGFEPLGSRVEIGWFLPHRWYRAGLPGRIFATPGRDCFTSLYRLFRGDTWRVTFCTVFTDGALVMTANQMVKLRIEQEGYLRWACPSSDLAEVLQRHRETVEDYRADSGRTVAALDLEGICEAIRHHSEQYLRKQGPALAMKSLPNALVFFGVFTVPIGLMLGFHHWAVPIAVGLGAVGYTAFLPYALRSGTAKIREQDRERELEYHWARRRREARRLREGLRLPEAPRTPPSDAITPPSQPEWSDDRIKGDSGPRGQ
jgi:hypothetical protein